MHQINKIGAAEVVDTYEPKEEGLDVVYYLTYILFNKYPALFISCCPDVLSTGHV